MKIEGYVGICGACFEPIKKGDEYYFRKGGSHFHKTCADSRPDSYYVALESMRAKFEKGSDPTQLLNEMERIFKIPMLNDASFNEDNKEVIELYKMISDARWSR